VAFIDGAVKPPVNDRTRSVTWCSSDPNAVPNLRPVGLSSRAASSGLQRAEPVPQAGLYRPHRSSGRIAGVCGVRGTWWRLMRRRRRAHRRRLSFRCGDSRNDALKEGNLIGLSTRFVLDLEMGAGSGTGSSPGGGPRASAVDIRRWSDALGRRRIRRGCRRARARGPGRHTSAYTGDVDLVKSAGGHAVMITAPGDQVAMVAGGDGMLHRQYGSSVSSAREETADGTKLP
jgi:hypothetical protein